MVMAQKIPYTSTVLVRNITKDTRYKLKSLLLEMGENHGHRKSQNKFIIEAIEAYMAAWQRKIEQPKKV